jgi:hypothetical protein
MQILMRQNDAKRGTSVASYYTIPNRFRSRSTISRETVHSRSSAIYYYAAATTLSFRLGHYFGCDSSHPMIRSAQEMRSEIPPTT